MSDQNAFTFSRTAANEDNWFGVQCPKTRKRIQDRLAQRARRKRLSALKNNTTRSSNATEDSDFQSTTTTTPRSDSEASSTAVSTTTTHPSQAASSIRSFSPSISPTPDTALASSAINSVFAALFQNGLILGIVCGTVIPSKSPRRGIETPAPLRPTALQMTRLHAPWLDRFPFPRMRDNFIELGGILDEEEFLHDLFTMESFTVDAGCRSWDPSGWRICGEFNKKWGYLFY